LLSKVLRKVCCNKTDYVTTGVIAVFVARIKRIAEGSNQELGR
jgi:hypothetical protein